MFRSLKKAAEMGDRFEVETDDFHKRVYEGFSEIAKKYPDRIIRIVPCESKSDTSEKIIGALRDRGLIK